MAFTYKGTNIPYQQYSREGNAAQWATDAYQSTFGRGPTGDELGQILPSYLGADPNVTDVAGGNAAVASMHAAQQNTPINISAKQQQDALDAYNKNPTQFDTQTNQIFQQGVGRAANADELTHFGSLLASGQIDSYGMQQLLGQSQEAQQRQTQQYQTQLQGNLQQSQSDYYNKYILPGIQSQFAQQGRSFDSSGFQQAAVQAGQQQNYQLQNYLAQFGAGQYGQSAQNQQDVYQQYLANQYGLQNAGIQQQLGQQAYMQQRNAQLQDFQMQQQAYNNYLNNYGKRGGNAVSGGISGAISGAGTGFMMGGPWGALAGGVAGGALGAYGGSQQNSAMGNNIGSSIMQLGQGYGNYQRNQGGGGGGSSPQYSDASMGYGSNGYMNQGVFGSGSGYNRYSNYMG